MGKCFLHTAQFAGMIRLQYKLFLFPVIDFLYKLRTRSGPSVFPDTCTYIIRDCH